MTGKSLCCCTYWTNTETPIVFGRNVTGLSQAWEPCCLCSDPIPFLNVFTYKRQITNNGILTDSRGRACPLADAAGATHSNRYLHIHASSAKGGTEAETIDTFFISMTNERYEQDKGVLDPFNWRCHHELHLDFFPFTVFQTHTRQL